MDGPTLGYGEDKSDGREDEIMYGE